MAGQGDDGESTGLRVKLTTEEGRMTNHGTVPVRHQDDSSRVVRSPPLSFSATFSAFSLDSNPDLNAKPIYALCALSLLTAVDMNAAVSESLREKQGFSSFRPAPHSSPTATTDDSVSVSVFSGNVFSFLWSLLFSEVGKSLRAHTSGPPPAPPPPHSSGFCVFHTSLKRKESSPAAREQTPGITSVVKILTSAATATRTADEAEAAGRERRRTGLRSKKTSKDSKQGSELLFKYERCVDFGERIEEQRITASVPAVCFDAADNLCLRSLCHFTICWNKTHLPLSPRLSLVTTHRLVSLPAQRTTTSSSRAFHVPPSPSRRRGARSGFF
ncbi:hypothetical protein F2P81_005266 [Scophthalmus maximus]|uniref:Uncharacterized protein n=1 Tax=Scophthalmus maximus TaxID=52904 RepID=A0A6A4TET5_SCOMX|nr:hypothetical protein F2P81_005266 [Scophthalmus maximus]